MRECKITSVGRCSHSGHRTTTAPWSLPISPLVGPNVQHSVLTTAFSHRVDLTVGRRMKNSGAGTKAEGTAIAMHGIAIPRSTLNSFAATRLHRKPAWNDNPTSNRTRWFQKGAIAQLETLTFFVPFLSVPPLPLLPSPLPLPLCLSCSVPVSVFLYRLLLCPIACKSCSRKMV